MKKETIRVDADELQTLIIAIRKAKGLTQTELAAKLKTSRQNVYAIETKRHALGLKKVNKIVSLLGGKLEILVTI
jgi:transcriptional regulator